MKSHLSSSPVRAAPGLALTCPILLARLAGITVQESSVPGIDDVPEPPLAGVTTDFYLLTSPHGV